MMWIKAHNYSAMQSQDPTHHICSVKGVMLVPRHQAASSSWAASVTHTAKSLRDFFSLIKEYSHLIPETKIIYTNRSHFQLHSFAQRWMEISLPSKALNLPTILNWNLIEGVLVWVWSSTSHSFCLPILASLQSSLLKFSRVCHQAMRPLSHLH